MILISVIRKHASKRLKLSSDKSSYLSILQIFESTNDVVDYTVVELDNNYQHIDLYLPNTIGFDKWKPLAK